MIVVVMGVAGSGKSTVARRLAARLGFAFAEGDDFHPESNVAKMRAGVPLSDDDRWPWLGAIASWIDARIALGEGGVVACSALKRVYRDLLRREPVRLVFLDGDPAVIAARIASRAGHFFGAELLESQLSTMEPPTDDERPIVVSVDATPDAIVEAIVRELRSREEHT